MNSSAQRYDASVDERAAYWAARLEGEPLEASERAELDAWLAQSGTHRAALSDYCQFSADLEEQLPALVAADRVRMPALQKVRRPWRFSGMASIAFAAAAAVVVAMWIGFPAAKVETVATTVAKRSAVHTLADGTRVELNAQTRLRFENKRNERRVHLEGGGEAIFMVTKDSARPFIVDSPMGSVRVTGTTFNVRSDASIGTFEVTVVEGSVQAHANELKGIRAPEGPVPLKAGQQLSARGGKVLVTALTASAVEDALAWRRGMVVLNDEPLREVAARFAHYHGRTITVAPEVANEPVGGQYSLEDLMGFVAGMKEALPLVDAAFNENGVVSFTPRSNR